MPLAIFENFVYSKSIKESPICERRTKMSETNFKGRVTIPDNEVTGCC